MSFDTRCYDLAEAFLSDTRFNDKAHIEELAQDIQTQIEVTIEYWESRPGRKAAQK